MGPELQLLLWVAGSVGIGLAATAYIHHIGGGWRRQALAESELGGLLTEVAIFLYCIGWPFLALISGALGVDLLGLGKIGVEGTPTLVGFTPLDWVRSSTTAGLAAGFVLIVLWLAGRASEPPAAGQPTPPGLPLTMRDAAYAEVHWAFYRAPFVLLLEDAQWGAAVGLAFVIAEWVLLRLLRRSSVLEDREHVLVLACCALTSGLLYATSRNLWLMIAAQALIRWAGHRLLFSSVHPAASQG
ncbi:MAG: hypothetical protein K6U78_09155 [Anaerolineae bacterium]|nr:hypothetical protein [Anaerolineae bacterium]